MRIVASNPTARDLKTMGVAHRRGFVDAAGVEHNGGGVQCASCGGYLGSTARIASAIGVGAGALSKWFNRAALRPDIAEKIRRAFLRVDE